MCKNFVMYILLLQYITTLFRMQKNKLLLSQHFMFSQILQWWIQEFSFGFLHTAQRIGELKPPVGSGGKALVGV